MLNHSSTVGVIILAAGDGKRMNADVPKVLVPLRGAPMIDYVMRAVRDAHLVDRPVVVVSKKHTLVQDYLGDRARYAIQGEQLGTGHAVGSAEHLFGSDIGTAVVLYGDMPFIQSASLLSLVEEHARQGNAITLMTVTVPNYDGSFAPLYNFGRVIRDSDGEIIRSVELKDATPYEKTVTEVNPCYYCFRAEWLWRHIRTLKNENAQKEYYLTDLIQMAIDEKEKISSIAIDPKEAIGINTKEDLVTAQSLILESRI